jgi:hypothetical protein
MVGDGKEEPVFTVEGQQAVVVAKEHALVVRLRDAPILCTTVVLGVTEIANGRLLTMDMEHDQKQRSKSEK